MSSVANSEHKQNILVVDDEPQITRVLKTTLSSQGYGVRTAADGEEALYEMKTWSPDLLITDLRMPGVDGLELCRRVRVDSRMPIIILSVKGEEAIKVEALDAGADDYITKPFSLRELEARIKSVLRRTRNGPSTDGMRDEAPIVRGRLRIDSAKREVTIGDRQVELTPKEFDLLRLFASNPGRVFPRKYLLEKIWDYSYEGYDRTIDSHINRLRAKIEENPENPQMVLTVWGIGYKFSDEQ